jgi:hypothetical protein
MSTRTFGGGGGSSRWDDDPFDQEAARREYKRSVKAKNRAETDAARAGYEAGREEERERSKGKHPSASSGGRKRSPARGHASRRTRGPVRKGTSKAVRQLQAPVANTVASGMRTLGLTLMVIALYQVLQNAGTFAGALGGLGRGLEWLSHPNASIPFKSDTTGGQRVLSQLAN